MKYEVGDTVLLLHSGEEGVVAGIMSGDMVLVNVEGVEFPVFTDQIDFPYFKRFSGQSRAKAAAAAEKKTYIDQVPPEKHFSKAEMAQAGVQLCLVPVYEPQSFDDNIRRFKLYLLNTLTEPFHFEYRVLYKEDADFSLTSTIDAQKDFYLHDIGQDALNDIARFLFLFSPVQADKTRMERLEVPLKIRPKTLFQKIAYMHQANEPSFSFMLFDTYPIKAPEPYFPLPEKGPPPYRPGAQEPPQSVVDLHMDKIPGGRAGLSGYEMLHAQLQYFEKCYQLAVAHMQPKLIVIHGIGSGRLRDEIHELLKHKREVRTFTNEYHAHFGFGATEIYFQY